MTLRPTAAVRARRWPLLHSSWDIATAAPVLAGSAEDELRASLLGTDGVIAGG